MSRRSAPFLNDTQLEVLRWVADGAPADIYEGYVHRIVARALRNRGLIEIAGRGDTWSASIEPDGNYFLEHGHYPPDSAETLSSVSSTLKPSKATPKAAVVKNTTDATSSPRIPKRARVGPTDTMMAALEAGGGRIEIGANEYARFHQLALSAKRFNKVPDGMQVLVHTDWKTAWVTLEKLPEWMTTILDPIAVPSTLRDASKVVLALQDREDLEIRVAEKKRALRLVQALVAECLKRAYMVTAPQAPHKNSWGRYERWDHNQGQVLIKIGADEYQLSIFQLTNKVEHVPSKWELAHGGRGYAIPQFDFPKTPELGIRIEGKDYHFWASTWTDTDARSLEDALPQIVQELELRHDRSEARREVEEKQRLEAQTQWELVREKAVEKLTRSHRADVLRQQAADWSTAQAISAYAEAMGQALAAKDEVEIEAMAEWIAWARSYAQKLNPLNRELRLPTPPEPTAAALESFMKPWSPYGPHR